MQLTVSSPLPCPLPRLAQATAAKKEASAQAKARRKAKSKQAAAKKAAAAQAKVAEVVEAAAKTTTVNFRRLSVRLLAIFAALLAGAAYLAPPSVSAGDIAPLPASVSSPTSPLAALVSLELTHRRSSRCHAR